MIPKKPRAGRKMTSLVIIGFAFFQADFPATTVIAAKFSWAVASPQYSKTQVL
jgi:hypothetical protein